MLTSWSVFFRSWQVILQIFKVPSLRRGHFGIDAEGSGEQLWRRASQFQNSSLKFQICCKPFRLSESKAPPNWWIRIATYFSNESHDLHRSHRRDQGTVQHPWWLHCWSWDVLGHAWISFIQAGARFVCNFLPSHPHMFASLAKASPIVQRHKCRHGQVSEDDWNRRKNA